MDIAADFDFSIGALVEGLWVDVPTYLNAKGLIERARRLDERA